MSLDTEGEPDTDTVPECQHCLSHTPHPLFVYMITDRPSECHDIESINKCRAYIGKSRHPLHRICSHNRLPGYRVGAKITKPGAPNWQAELIVGPFYNGASEYKNLWRNNYRNVVRRIIGGVTLATEHGLTMYVRDDATRDLIEHLLTHVAA